MPKGPLLGLLLVWGPSDCLVRFMQRLCDILFRYYLLLNASTIKYWNCCVVLKYIYRTWRRRFLLCHGRAPQTPWRRFCPPALPRCFLLRKLGWNESHYNILREEQEILCPNTHAPLGVLPAVGLSLLVPFVSTSEESPLWVCGLGAGSADAGRESGNRK